QGDHIPELTWKMFDQPSWLEQLWWKIKEGRLIICFLIGFFLAFVIYPSVSPIVEGMLHRDPTTLPDVVEKFCYPKNNPDNAVNKFLSCGEKTIFDSLELNGEIFIKKQEGMKYFTEKSFYKTVNSLKETITLIQKEKNQNGQPTVTRKMLEDAEVETSVFLENAKILQKVSSKQLLEKDILLIAVALPGLNQEEGYYQTSKYTLQAIAHLQEENNNKPNSKKVLILLANDTNNAGEKEVTDLIIDVKNVAKEINNRHPYALIGYYSSRITYYALLKYDNNNYSNNIPVITFSASATKSLGPKPIGLTYQRNLYQVTSTNEQMAKKLIKYFEDNNIENVLPFYRDETLYSSSFFKDFQDNWKHSLSKQNSSLQSERDIDGRLENILNNNDPQKTAILLCPDAFTQSEDAKSEIDNTKRILKLKQSKYKNFLVGSCEVITAYQESSNI
ncbi:MAG: ABC transporter substrate-binding protein, partial [Ignavibacteria bacterium]|nr:ABC transporter substrate-binding protein [Ignavibacteria bacterium]